MPKINAHFQAFFFFFRFPLQPLNLFGLGPTGYEVVGIYYCTTCSLCNSKRSHISNSKYVSSSEVDFYCFTTRDRQTSRYVVSLSLSLGMGVNLDSAL